MITRFAFFEGHVAPERAAEFRKAVIEELVTVHGVNRALLTPVGYGESRLINPSSPNAAENRRVEILLR